jgi:hypothetical protein
VRFEEEDVSVLGGDLRLASFKAGEAVAVWWWRGGQHGDARSVYLSLCLILTCSLSLSPDPAGEQRRAMVVACGGGLGCPAACVAAAAAGSVNGGGVCVAAVAAGSVNGGGVRGEVALRELCIGALS